jgi:glucitol operon activator protein
MSATSTVLLALALFWGLQIAGSWMQWKHYHGALAAIRSTWNDGYVGVGRFRRKFHFGCIAVLVVAPDMQIRTLQLLRGITVFARFQDIPLAKGMDLAHLPAQLEREAFGEKCLMAVKDAILQIEEIKSKTEHR